MFALISSPATRCQCAAVFNADRVDFWARARKRRSFARTRRCRFHRPRRRRETQTIELIFPSPNQGTSSVFASPCSMPFPYLPFSLRSTSSSSSASSSIACSSSRIVHSSSSAYPCRAPPPPPSPPPSPSLCTQSLLLLLFLSLSLSLSLLPSTTHLRIRHPCSTVHSKSARLRPAWILGIPIGNGTSERERKRRSRRRRRRRP